MEESMKQEIMKLKIAKGICLIMAGLVFIMEDQLGAALLFVGFIVALEGIEVLHFFDSKQSKKARCNG